MSTTEAPPATRLAYDVFVNDPPPQDGVLPNGEPKRCSPTASTLIYGSEDGVLTDPPTPATAVTVPENRLTLEDHDLVIVEVGDTDSADTTVLHVPELGLLVAGDVLYNGVHMYLAQGESQTRVIHGRDGSLQPRS